MPRQSCTGWWDQAGFGRQPMEGLLVAIENGQVEGSGLDVVGPFALEGTLAESGEVRLVKLYLGAHDVDYLGRYDGATRLWGRWRLPFASGAWEIRLKAPAAERAAGVEIETAEAPARSS